MTFTDMLLYIEDFAALVGYMDEHYPDTLLRDEDGNLTDPPVITNLTRTPAVVKGNSLLVYARLRPEEVDKWASVPGVEILAQEEFTGRGTAQRLYAQVFDDTDKSAKYDSVYDRGPVEDEEGNTYSPPEMFGVMAGAL